MTIPTPPSKFRRLDCLYSNKYLIKESNNSKVYVASQIIKKNRKIVVIKYIPIKDSNSIIKKMQIDREVDIQSSLHNKYVMTLIDIFDLQNKFRVLVMEKGLGTLVSGYAQDDKFFKSLPQIFKIMYQISKGLYYIHKNHILHGDIKPSNIIIMDDNEYMPHIQIIDFGHAVHLPKFDGTDATCCKCHNLTPMFSAPELLRLQPHSYPSDIWALGATFYFIITENYLVHGIHDNKLIAEQLEKNKDGNYDKRSGPYFPQSGKDLIRSMLNPSPLLRPTIKDVIHSDFFKEVLDDQWLAEEEMFSNTSVHILDITNSIDLTNIE